MWISHWSTDWHLVLINDLDLHRVADQDRWGHASRHHGNIQLGVHVLVLVLQTLGDSVHIHTGRAVPHAVSDGQSTGRAVVSVTPGLEDNLGHVATRGTLGGSVGSESVRDVDATGGGVVGGVTEESWWERCLQGHTFRVAALKDSNLTGQNLPRK